MNESLTDILKLRLSANPSVPLEPPMTAADKMVRVLLVKAMNGDVEAIREVWDRVEAYQEPQVLSGYSGFMDMVDARDKASSQKFQELCNVGGKAWDKIEDPEVYLKETTG